MAEDLEAGRWPSIATSVENEEIALAAALKVAPRGAFALSGVALALLIVAWLLMYIFVFLPRGAVG